MSGTPGPLAPEAESSGHAAFAHRRLARRAVDDGDEAAALGHLSALVGLDARSAADLAVSVALAFPEAAVTEALQGAPAISAKGEGDEGRLSLTVHPNPTARSATVVLGTAATDTEVAVFDALGRRVATLRAERGARQIALDVSALAPGLYVARATSADDAQVAVARFTVAR